MSMSYIEHVVNTGFPGRRARCTPPFARREDPPCPDGRSPRRNAAGRSFVPQDGLAAPRVAIVSKAFADREWRGENPIGKRIKLGRVNSAAAWRTVVGVAAPTRYRELAEPRRTVDHVDRRST